MIKYLFNKIYFIIKYIIFLILIFVIIESLSRGFIWIVTKDFKTFLYGFNKDIKVNIFHLRKFDIKLTDLYSVNQATINNNEECTTLPPARARVAWLGTPQNPRHTTPCRATAQCGG